MHLACELAKVIRHFFPDLLPLLKKVKDPRNQSYITYQSHILLMIRILSSIFYISSMRKTSEEFNSQRVIENIGYLCGQELSELPYRKTVSHYLQRLDPQELQKIVCRLVRRLLRTRAFEDAKVRGKYWQAILDRTQLGSNKKQLDCKSLYRVHNRGTDKEYTEYYYCNDILIFRFTTASLRGSSKCRVQGTQLCSGIACPEMPVDFCRCRISLHFPR